MIQYGILLYDMSKLEMMWNDTSATRRDAPLLADKHKSIENQMFDFDSTVYVSTLLSVK